MKRIMVGMVAAMALAGVGYSAGAKTDKADRYFEMRTYTPNAGKLPALHARFKDHTIKLFEKHGITNVAYWTTATENPDLVFILAYSSKEAREKSWKAFGGDPEWQKAKADSEKDGVLVSKVVSTFMNPTEYSAIK